MLSYVMLAVNSSGALDASLYELLDGLGPGPEHLRNKAARPPVIKLHCKSKSATVCSGRIFPTT